MRHLDSASLFFFFSPPRASAFMLLSDTFYLDEQPGEDQ